LRAVPEIRAAKISPTPMAAPAKAIVASPAPINLAAITIFIILIFIPLTNTYEKIKEGK
jgi:hypothetical protein